MPVLLLLLCCALCDQRGAGGGGSLACATVVGAFEPEYHANVLAVQRRGPARGA